MYDAFDNRIGVSVDPGSPEPQLATTTWTAYDGSNRYADFAGSTLTDRHLAGAAIDKCSESRQNDPLPSMRD